MPPRSCSSSRGVRAGARDGVPSGVEEGVALDCEMVQLRSGRQAVARIGVVGYDERTLLDVYVSVPSAEVADYQTRVSGIREEHLIGAIGFEQARQAVVELCAGRVLIGHGLACDLKCLRLAHPRERLVDTEALDWGSRRRNLGALCHELLGDDIQRAAHCPVEDARGAVRLLKAYLANGGPPPERVEAVGWSGARMPPPPPPCTAPEEAPARISLPWERAHLVALLKWFARLDGAACAALAFAPSLSKAERGLVHKQAQALGLRTRSEGEGEERTISVFGAAHAGAEAAPPRRCRAVELLFAWSRLGEPGAESAAHYSLDELAQRAAVRKLSEPHLALLERALRITANVYADAHAADASLRQTAPDAHIGRLEAALAHRAFRCLGEFRATCG